MSRRAKLALLATLGAICLVADVALAQAGRPALPVRDPDAPGYAKATLLPDGEVPRPDLNGAFVIGPTHPAAPEMTPSPQTPKGTIYTLTMSSTDSRIYPGIMREPGTLGVADPTNPARMIVTTSHPAPYTRKVSVYVPQQYLPGTRAPFIVAMDGPDAALFTALETLIAQKRVPVMIGIAIGNGGGDAQGSQRGLEYDTMSDQYARFVETEVLPLVEREAKVRLAADPDGRAAMGTSSGGAAALIMAWYRPDLYHRVLTYSGTFVNQQWPFDPKTPQGAWAFHQSLIPNAPRKPIRLWFEVSDRDNYNMNALRDGMHDWVEANENMVRVLAAKGYDYQFVFAKNAGHGDRAVKAQTLPEALEWLWKGYKPRD